MRDPPEEIELDSVDDLTDSRVLDHINYIVAGGDVYRVYTNDYAEEHYLQLTDEIPDDYWGRYDD